LLEPKINNHLKVVVGGLIYQNKKILICQRKEEGDHPLKWEFPGGKVKELEDNQEALSRELKEELNIEINEMIFFDEYLYRFDTPECLYSVFRIFIFFTLRRTK